MLVRVVFHDSLTGEGEWFDLEVPEFTEADVRAALVKATKNLVHPSDHDAICELDPAAWVHDDGMACFIFKQKGDDPFINGMLHGIAYMQFDPSHIPQL